MEKNKNVKALNRIFTESETSGVELDKLDQELTDLGIDPGDLVKKGMERIAALQKQGKEVRLKTFNPHALAAKKRKK